MYNKKEKETKDNRNQYGHWALTAQVQWSTTENFSARRKFFQSSFDMKTVEDFYKMYVGEILKRKRDVCAIDAISLWDGNTNEPFRLDKHHPNGLIFMLHAKASKWFHRYSQKFNYN